MSCPACQILESEGSKQSLINHAEGQKAEVILKSEAARIDAVNRATGAAPQPRNLENCNVEN